MTTVDRPISILEFRSVRGTGGGPEKTILLGAARTDPAKYAITVCYLRDQRDDVFHVDQRAGVLPIDYVEIRERHSFDRSIWAPLRRLVRERRIDIIHAHDYKTDFLALLLAHVEPVIPLSTAHGFAGHSWREERVYYPADRWLLARFPRTIAVSSDIRNSIVRAGGDPARITVVPNGVDHSQFRRDRRRQADVRRDLGLAAEDVVVGAVGRLESEKNYPLLMRAVGRLAASHPRLFVLIGGEGAERKRLETLSADLGIADRTRLLGQVQDIVGLHHALDVFVMCSDNEGSPNAVLEAMAMETSVVATEVGGVSDLITCEEHGLLVPRRDLDRLTEALRRMLDDPDTRSKMARSARLRVERELSFDQRMKQVEAIYDELMATYPGVRRGLTWRGRKVADRS